MLSPKLVEPKYFLSAMLTICLCSPVACAQNQPGRNPQRRTESRTPEQQRVQKLSRMEPLPDLPAYTGKVKLRVAHLTAANPSGPEYTYVFGTDEPPATVHDWYLQALSSSGWRLSRGREGPTEPIIGFHSSGKQISVLVQSARELDEKSSVTLVFVNGANR